MRHAISIVLVLAFGWHAHAAAVRLTVEEPGRIDRQGWPVTSGIPFAQGQLTDATGVLLVSEEGKPLPLQTEPLAFWPDGSIRWLLLDFQVDLPAGEKRTYELRYGADVRPQEVERRLEVRKTADKVVVQTGPMQLELTAQGFRPLDALWLDANGDGQFAAGERVTGRSSGLVLTDAQGRTFQAAAGPAEIAVEQAGPLRACVRLAGHHASDQGQMFRYVVRIHAFRGQPFVRMHYTFINDHQDALMAQIQQLDLGVRLAPEGGAAKHGLLDGKRLQEGRLFQSDENHYDFHGQPAGKQAAGWAALGGDRVGLAVGLREFWQNWPKAIELKSGELHLGLCPRLPEGLYDGKPLREESKLYYYLRGGQYTFKVGVARTHELWATSFAGTPNQEKLSQFFQATQEPLLATCEPAYVSSTKALGEFPPADPTKFCGYDAWLEQVHDAHEKLRVTAREFGMLNYGDWYGERGVNWGNLEYDLAHGLFIQYLRTGDRRYFRRAEQAARHHIDVDVIHATNPHLTNPWGKPPQVGEIWLHCLCHTGGYYENTSLPVERTYHMGHSTNFGHVWVTGDLEYYYLTGDRRALEVSRQMADAMASHCPTSYGTHIRNLGWPMILLLSAYEATGEKKYLDAATKNWEVLKKNLDPKRGWVVRLAKDHCFHGDRRCEGNVPFMEGLTLGALARYHRVTHDPEVLQAISVGVDQMIRECWMDDVKTFRYTACPKSPKAPCGFAMSIEALAYETALTGNPEHKRVLHEGFRTLLKESRQQFGKSLGMLLFFAPYGLSAVAEE